MMTFNPDSLTQILSLGDSYTIGEGVTAAESFPFQLTARLRQAGWSLPEPQIVARTGWTTAELLAALDAAADLAEIVRPGHVRSGPYRLATLLAGVNNQYRGQPLAAYEAEFAELLRRAQAYAGGQARRVIVLSIPDWGVTPFAAGRDRAAIADQIDAFNAANRSLALAAGCAYVDVTAISRRAADEPSLLAADGLHPSGQMYATWVEAALPSVTAALNG